MQRTHHPIIKSFVVWFAGLSQRASNEGNGHSVRFGVKGGRPRSKKRCWCGAQTMYSAANRNFDCCRKAGKIVLVGDRRAQ